MPHPGTIQDEFTNAEIGEGKKRRPVTRQHRLQLRRIRDGLCVTCGKPRGPENLRRCDKCKEKDRARHAKKYIRVIQ